MLIVVIATAVKSFTVIARDKSTTQDEDEIMNTEDDNDQLIDKRHDGDDKDYEVKLVRRRRGHPGTGNT